jgi:hypothetical protein
MVYTLDMIEMPETLDDVPGWLRAHARAFNMRVLFVMADDLDRALADRAEVEAAAWNAGATVVPIPATLTDTGAELFRAGAFAMLHSIDRARVEADAGNAFAAGYLAELTGAPEHDYNTPPPPPTTTTRVRRPERPRCPHCGDRFRTVAELATHTRDTGDTPTRPPYACPVLWTRRHPNGDTR